MASLRDARRRVMALHRPRLTGRRVIIAAMALFMAVLLASPLQSYLSRRSSVAASQHQQQELQQRVKQLQRETARWQDPAYVARQARDRLGYVQPGDTLYTVLNADGTPKSPSAPAGVDADAVTKSGHTPSWNATLWSSIEVAGKSK